MDTKKETIKMSETKYSGNEKNKCRICLKEGSLPIYGPDCATDLSYDIRTFGDIDLSYDDEFPKYLCDACYKLLQCAILFRKAAKQSEELLKKSVLKTDSFSDLNCSVNSPVSPICDVDNIESEISERPTQWELVQQYFIELSESESSKIPICPNIGAGKRVQCRICNKIVTKAYGRDHYALHDPSLPKYICHICGKSFRQQSALINHRFTHSTDFKFKCKLCPYKARSSGLLKGHMRRHTGDYRYMCAECPARFLTKSNLNRHSLKHKESTFQCDTCKKFFHCKFYLRKHYEVEHLGVKKFNCNFCGKNFGYRKAMRKHEVDVHKQEKRAAGRMPTYLQVKLNGNIEEPVT